MKLQINLGGHCIEIVPETEFEKDFVEKFFDKEKTATVKRGYDGCMEIKWADHLRFT